MKFILFVFLTALIVIFLNPIMPYWSIMILIGVSAALFGKKGAGAFFAGGLGMGLAWLGQSIYITAVSGSHLADKLSELMGFGSDIALHALTGVLGFLLGAFSAWTGSLFRKLFNKRPDNIYKG